LPRDNIDALAQALARLAQDAGLRERLGGAGRLTIEERYSFTARMEKIRGIYAAALGGN
jgi:glycosyltransferase involved in cell wall biosynthesis